jgi:hypothetical protein
MKECIYCGTLNEVSGQKCAACGGPLPREEGCGAPFQSAHIAKSRLEGCEGRPGE